MDELARVLNEAHTLLDIATMETKDDVFRGKLFDWMHEIRVQLRKLGP